MTPLDYTVLGLYFLVMVGIGLWAMRGVKKSEDYFMGGRAFGRLMQTFAAFGAGTGAHEPVSVGRTSWTSGLSGIWSALMWLFVTPFYWITAVWYRRMRHLTLGDWFVERYESKAMGAAYTLFGLVFYMLYLSTMFSAITKFAVPLIGVEAVNLLGFAEPVGMEYLLVPTIAILVVVYGVLGGLTAAYWTDLIQGLFIILLSVLLIPSGLMALVERYGDPQTQGMLEGFVILHDRVPEDYFGLFSGPRAGEFPPHYILSLTMLAFVGVVVQPHFITTGGGSAKTEDSARIGLVVGNFLKRLCTVGWAGTALIALALLAGNLAVAEDPDRVWGIAAREILGPWNLGLVGLMLACLLAALMSSADTYMLVGSALVVKNVYGAYIDPEAGDEKFVFYGRIAGLLIILGAAGFSLYQMDVFAQLKLGLELPIVFAAPFWVGMYWRRANRTAVWLTMASVLVVFFVLPLLLPVAIPDLRTNPAFHSQTQLTRTVTRRPASEIDVAQREAARALWETRRKAAMELTGADERSKAIAELGPRPEPVEVGEPFVSEVISGGSSIFWRDGLKPIDAEGRAVEIEPVAIGEVQAMGPRTERTLLTWPEGTRLQGTGSFQPDFLLYRWLGYDLRDVTPATLETLRLPPRLVTPFLLLILLSFVTPRNSAGALDRYYAKMKTVVRPDPVDDAEELARSYADPHRFDDRKLFPGSSLEFVKPRPIDVAGFVISVLVCLLIVGFVWWLSGLGR